MVWKCPIRRIWHHYGLVSQAPSSFLSPLQYISQRRKAGRVPGNNTHSVPESCLSVITVKVACFSEFSRSTNLESKLIEFFITYTWCVEGAEMSCTTSVIPEELEAIISSLKLGKPMWTLHNTEKGYGVKLFWKNNSKGSGTSINSHSSRRHLRGKRRMEKFLQKKHDEGKYRAHTYSQEAKSRPDQGCWWRLTQKPWTCPSHISWHGVEQTWAHYSISNVLRAGWLHREESRSFG